MANDEVEMIGRERVGELFLDQFSALELKRLIKFLATSHLLERKLDSQNKALFERFAKKDADSVRQSFPLRPVFSFFNLLLIGKFQYFGEDEFWTHEKVLEFVKSVKELVKKNPPEVEPNDAIIEKTPSISHALLGTVEVTRHSWARFLERSMEIPRDEAKNIPFTKKLVEQLQLSFARSFEVILPRKIALTRCLNNNVRRAVYFYDSKTDLRFVISADEPKTLLTVEVPVKE